MIAFAHQEPWADDPILEREWIVDGSITRVTLDHELGLCVSQENTDGPLRCRAVWIPDAIQDEVVVALTAATVIGALRRKGIQR